MTYRIILSCFVSLTSAIERPIRSERSLFENDCELLLTFHWFSTAIRSDAYTKLCIAMQGASNLAMLRPRLLNSQEVFRMDRDHSLREHLQKLLDWEDAHISFDRAVDGIDPKKRGKVPAGHSHSPWQLLEHLRRCQFDILDFSRNSKYEQPSMDDYWPSSVAPTDEAAWRDSVSAFRRDREELKKLAIDTRIDLLARIPHGSGQTYLRELILVADHNAYHVGQLVTVRRALGNWSD